MKIDKVSQQLSEKAEQKVQNILSELEGFVDNLVREQGFNGNQIDREVYVKTIPYTYQSATRLYKLTLHELLFPLVEQKTIDDFLTKVEKYESK